MRHIGLFAGIGGFELAARWMGWNTIAWSEWDPFCQKVLSYHFPEAKGYGDIKQADFTQYQGQCDILTGGFPCQPFSVAGKRLGKEDERHLWLEMLRVIREVRPRWIIGENVRGLLSWNEGVVFDEVCSDLESEGYEVQAFIIPAASVGAPHRRDRVWFVAYAKNYGCDQRGKDINEWKEHKSCNGEKIRNIITANGEQQTTPHPNSNGLNGSDCQHEEQSSKGGEYAQCNFEQMGGDVADSGYELQGSKFNGSIGASRSQSHQFTSRFICSTWENFPTISPVCGGDDGLPSELDSITIPKWRKESIKAYGNAIVPQVAYQLFQAIKNTKSLDY